MPPLDLALAVLALLMTPGPSNSLMLLAGAERGFPGATRLIPAEALGYLVTILPLVWVGEAALDRLPGLHGLVVLVAAVWVAVLAVRLWRRPAAGDGQQAVGARALFVTTALNPKALIFGLVLLPDPDRLGQNLALFAGLVVLVALVWAGLGAGLRQAAMQGRATRGPGALVLFRRAASIWLAAISVTLTLRGIGA